MFDWLQDLINGITDAIANAFSGIGQQISNTIWNTMMKWFYETIYNAVADFFTMMGNMGAEIFDLKWVQATVHLFTLFGWALFIAGVVVAIFDVAIEYQKYRSQYSQGIFCVFAHRRCSHRAISVLHLSAKHLLP